MNLGGNDHRWNAFNSYTALANVTKIHGSHTFKFGWEGRMFRVNNWEARAAGTFNFNAQFTQGPNPNQASATAGNSIASLLLGTGTADNFLYIGGWKNAASQSFYHGFFFQDDWRATPRLTLNLGLRYDLDTPRTERFNRTNHFDRSIRSPLADIVPGFDDLRGGLAFVGVDGRNRYQYNWDTNNPYSASRRRSRSATSVSVCPISAMTASAISICRSLRNSPPRSASQFSSGRNS